MTQFIPGVPIKRYNPCLDPQQRFIPHVLKPIKVEGGVVTRPNVYVPNHGYYPEWVDLIQKFIDHKEG